MDYAVTISTQHSHTSPNHPAMTAMHLTKGRLVGGWIWFPPGSAGLLRVQVWRSLNQLAPSVGGQWYRGDDCVLPLYIGYTLSTHPLDVVVRTWNASTTYDHECTVSLFLDNPGHRSDPELTKIRQAIEAWAQRVKRIVEPPTTKRQRTEKWIKAQ
jgi:hypothetical protein